MAAPNNATHYADLTHNLGYKPIVMAYAFFDYYGMHGWRRLPVTYWYVIGPGMYDMSAVYYEHTSVNNVRFYGPEDLGIKVQLYLEPRKDAWYE